MAACARASLALAAAPTRHHASRPHRPLVCTVRRWLSWPHVSRVMPQWPRRPLARTLRRLHCARQACNTWCHHHSGARFSPSAHVIAACFVPKWAKQMDRPERKTGRKEKNGNPKFLRKGPRNSKNFEEFFAHKKILQKNPIKLGNLRDFIHSCRITSQKLKKICEQFSQN